MPGSGWEFVPISWEAVATLLTGGAAVLGAVIVGKRQVSLQEKQTELIRIHGQSEQEFRRTETKLNLLNRRADIIILIKEVYEAFIQKSRLDGEDLTKIIRAMNEAQLIFPRDFSGTLQNVLGNAINSQSKFNLSRARHAQGKEAEAQRALDEANAMEAKIFEDLPQVIELLIDHTAVVV